MNRDTILKTRIGLIHFLKDRLESSSGDLYDSAYAVSTIHDLVHSIESQLNRDDDQVREDAKEVREKERRRKKKDAD